MRLSEAEAKERVAKGAAFLDGQRPGWAGRVNVGNLKLRDACYCVLGQIYGNYYQCRSVLLVGSPEATSTQDTAAAFGFDVFKAEAAAANKDGVSLDPLYHTLQDAWIAAIADRLIPQASSERPRASEHDVFQPLSAEVESVGVK